MTSKEAIFDIEINIAIHGLNFNREIEVIKQDLEVLEHIKVLVKQYDNGELGYINFVQEVKEVLDNDE